MNGIEVHIDDRQSDCQFDLEHARDLLAVVLCDQGVVPPAEVGLMFVSVQEMTELNERHMHHAGASGATDVLAFPIDGVSRQAEGQPVMVGDIIICPAIADQAAQPLDDELALLTVHGALHLIGHDHYAPEEAAVMQTAQRDLLHRFHVRSSEAHQ